MYFLSLMRSILFFELYPRSKISVELTGMFPIIASNVFESCIFPAYDSKNSMEKWMNRDYASIIFPKASSQDFWNVMDRFSDKDREGNVKG